MLMNIVEHLAAKEPGITPKEMVDTKKKAKREGILGIHSLYMNDNVAPLLLGILKSYCLLSSLICQYSVHRLFQLPQVDKNQLWLV